MIQKINKKKLCGKLCGKYVESMWKYVESFLGANDLDNKSYFCNPQKLVQQAIPQLLKKSDF